MTTNGTQLAGLQKAELPPGRSRQPYVLQSLCGEIIYIPCSRSATRLLVTGKETDNAFAVVGTGGAQSAPIGFHYHRDAHDVFLCLKGQVNVWANDQARTLGPGDFASAPPLAVHQYQIVGPHTEFLGLIVPGGWEEFFRFIGEPYDGPLFPLSDARNPLEVLLPKLKAAAEQFDMVPCPQHPCLPPQPLQETDNRLPGERVPYFLRHGSGPAFVVGGTVVRPLARARESHGRFSVASLAGSSFHRHASVFAKGGVVFHQTSHCFYVSEGSVRFALDEVEVELTAGETIYVPQGTRFSWVFLTRLAQLYAFSNGIGLSEVLCEAGEAYEGDVPPEKAARSPWDRVRGLQESFGCVWT